MARSFFRGNEIVLKAGGWVYADTGDRVEVEWMDRACGCCGRHETKDGHDQCLGELPGVINACCGHGKKEESYIMFENGVVVRGFRVEERS